jgi:spore coat protein U domain-containing protein, fimbrial subunit CupE1/2/3/6
VKPADDRSFGLASRPLIFFWGYVRKKLTLILALVSAFMGGDVHGATTTTTFTVQITITASCTIVSASTLNFGSQGVLTANVDQTSTIQVQCTNTTPYNIGLDAGTATGATVTTRKMTNAGATISYSLYSNSARTTNWGNTVGTDTVAATGNGASQSYTVYGRVPPQTTPAPATYTDTITVTVTY